MHVFVDKLYTNCIQIVYKYTRYSLSSSVAGFFTFWKAGRFSHGMDTPVSLDPDTQAPKQIMLHASICLCANGTLSTFTVRYQNAQ